jgi:hypothetical protein
VKALPVRQYGYSTGEFQQNRLLVMKLAPITQPGQQDKSGSAVK